MKNTVKIVVAVIAVLGLQGSAFANQSKPSPAGPVVIDAQLTRQKLARIVDHVRRTGHHSSDRFDRQVHGTVYEVQVRPIVGSSPGDVPGTVRLTVRELMLSETDLTPRRARAGIPPRVIQQRWAPLKLTVELVQPSPPAGNRWMTAQVNVGSRRSTGRAFGELFNVNVGGLRGDQIPEGTGNNLANYCLSLVRETILKYVPRLSCLVRR